MYTKLTLNIDKTIVEQAKKYAKKNGQSLSKLIESYLRMVSEKPENIEDLEISPEVKSLMGSFKAAKDLDYKEELSKAIARKHLK